MRHSLCLAASLLVLPVASAQQLKLSASDAAPNDTFGWAVAIDGNTAVIGAPDRGDLVAGLRSGAAYLFDLTTGAQTFSLSPGTLTQDDYFGCAVAISGNTALVGAYAYWQPANLAAGGAFLFDTTTGQLLSEFAASDYQSGDYFGKAVAFSGDLAIVGAPAGNWSPGEAYLFDLSNPSFPLEIAKILPSNNAPDGAQFGRAVAISGNIAVVGSPHENENGSDTGSAYIFNAATGQLMHKLLASVPDSYSHFGWSVATDGDLVLVGAKFATLNNASLAGAAYLYDANTGTELAILQASDANSSDYFGTSVAIEGDTAVVGVESSGSYDEINESSSGSLYLFDISNPSVPVEIGERYASDGESGDDFGASAAISGTTALIGAPQDQFNEGPGFAYIYDLVVHPYDECLGAALVGPFSTGTFSFDTTGLSTSTDPATTGVDGQSETLCYAFGSSAVNNDMWFRWQAPNQGGEPRETTVSFCDGGTTLDTKIAVWLETCPPVPGTALACNDDTCSLQSEVQFTSHPYDTYLIQVGSFSPLSTGSGTFTIDIADPPPPGTTFCYGDGTGTPCPCGNVGASGEGCANSTGTGAFLDASGSTSISTDSFDLTSTGLPPGPGLYFQGNNAINAGNGIPFGDGLRCAGNQVIRLQIRFSISGDSSTTISIATKGGVSAGDTMRYQHWYRDADTSPCNSLFNLTNGYEITWTP